MKVIFQNRYLLDLAASIMFFTRIPINWTFFSKEPPNLTRAAWCFPFVGFIIGILSGMIGDLCILINLPIFLSCSIAVSLSVLITGAFHEDGLADMADGFGAGGSADNINKIMHDSRLGTYGTVSLILAFFIRLSLVIELAELGYSIILILSTGFASGKLALLFLRNSFNTSIFSRTGSIIEYVSPAKLTVATILWLLPSIFIFPFSGILLGIFLVSVALFCIGRMAEKKIGGITGDVLGAGAFLTELVFLFGVIIYLKITF